jgi:hypothetical protein
MLYFCVAYCEVPLCGIQVSHSQGEGFALVFILPSLHSEVAIYSHI